MTRLTPLAILACLLALGCDTTLHARVSDGAGLAEGSPVLVSGVTVGEVKSLAIMEGEVDIEFTIEDEHEITLREDTCALAVRGETGPGLVLVPGEGAPLNEEQAERPIAECRLPGSELNDLFAQLGDTLGSMIRAFGQGLGGAGGGGSGGGSGGTIPIPPIPQPPAPGGGGGGTAPVPVPPIGGGGAGGACGSVSVRVDGVERVDPVPLLLTDGGYRAWLVFQNDGDETMRMGPISQATFTDAQRQSLSVARIPSEQNGWFMPFDVPAHGTARVSVVFETSQSPRIGEIEARGAAPASSPTSTCTVRATQL